METKLGSEMKVGDVFAINGDKFKVIKIEPVPHNPNSRKVRYVSQTSGREYISVVWKDDSFRVA